MKPKLLALAAAAGCGLTTLGVAAGPTPGAGASPSSCWATATSAAACGGMRALVAAAKKEGHLNVIALPKNWANYGAIMADFTKKYGITINDANPDGSSQQELNAVTQLKGQSRAPDVLDVGTSFAIKGAGAHLLAPYKVRSWKDIPASARAASGTWYDDYGGFVAIGYDPRRVHVPPTSFKDLEKPIYKNMVAINGNPTQAGAAFAAVYAAALANGGSFSNIEPGIKYFAHLHQIGNFVPVTGSPATVQSGQTPILVWWGYLLASEVKSEVKGFKIVVPSDASYAAYYSQAINKDAPDPAAARLWEEYLYSVQGQNLWLKGMARPIELPTLVAHHRQDKAAFRSLPLVKGSAMLAFPSSAESAKAETLVAKQWASAVG